MIPYPYPTSAASLLEFRVGPKRDALAGYVREGTFFGWAFAGIQLTEVIFRLSYDFDKRSWEPSFLQAHWIASSFAGVKRIRRVTP